MKRKWKWSRSVVSNSLWPHGLLPTRLLCPWDFPGNSTGVDCHFLLQGIFPTQGRSYDVFYFLFVIIYADWIFLWIKYLCGRHLWIILSNWLVIWKIYENIFLPVLKILEFYFSTLLAVENSEHCFLACGLATKKSQVDVVLVIFGRFLYGSFGILGDVLSSVISSVCF